MHALPRGRAYGRVPRAANVPFGTGAGTRFDTGARRSLVFAVLGAVAPLAPRGPPSPDRSPMPMPRTFVFRRSLAAALVALAAGLPAMAHAQSDVPVAAGTTTRVTSLYHKFEITAAFTGVILNSNIRLDS